MGEKAQVARETEGGHTAEGSAATNTANPGETNAPERQAATHQEEKIDGEVSTVTGVTNSVDTINWESSGLMTRARRAKTGITTDGGGGATQQADGDGKSRGGGHTVRSINNTNSDGNHNECTNARVG